MMLNNTLAKGLHLLLQNSTMGKTIERDHLPNEDHCHHRNSNCTLTIPNQNHHHHHISNCTSLNPNYDAQQHFSKGIAPFTTKIQQWEKKFRNVS
jgi:hypothetical protein